MVPSLLLKLRVSFLWLPASRHVHRQPAAMGYKNSLPERWTEYIPVGKRIPGTRFIAFKVPLKNVYDNKLAPWQRFSAADLIKEVEKQNEELGLVVDLTCTMRYYSPEELPQTVMYSKIFTVGREVPSDQVITQFKCTVKQYLSQNAENDKLVGVHCTHGLNRTGYLVCRYLIDLLSMEPSEAIEKFNSSRGHSMERSNYIDDLLHGKSRSNAGLDKPQAKQHLSGWNVNSGPPSYSEEQLQSHGAGLAKHRQHFSRRSANPQLPPYPEEQPRSHGHPYNTPRWGPRDPGPPSAQTSLHQKPGRAMGPRVPHAGGRYPSHGPRMPPPGFPRPHMPGPRHSLPQMESNQSHFFRGPNRHRHHPQRPFPQHYDGANGAAPQHCRPRFTPPSDNNPANCFLAHPPHSQLHSNNNPYQRYPKPGPKKKPRTQWQ